MRQDHLTRSALGRSLGPFSQSPWQLHVAAHITQAGARLGQGRKRRAGHEGALADVQVGQAPAQRLQRANACTVTKVRV